VLLSEGDIHYAEIEANAPYKSEYFRGEIFAMAGGPIPHGEIMIAASAELRARINRRLCRVLPADVRIRIAATGLQTYSDFSVVCGAAGRAQGRTDCIENPVLICEVLSQSTEAYDRRAKFELCSCHRPGSARSSSATHEMGAGP